MSTSSEDKLGLIFGRRSIRVYSPGAISDDTIKRLLEAAMAAPSAMTKDPWRFIVVRDGGTLSCLAAVLPGGRMLATATLAIVACGDLDAAFERQLSYLLQDCSAAIQNLLLGAHALGLGACWVGVHPSEDAIGRLKQMLALPGHIIPIAVIALGYPGEQPEPRTRYNPDYVCREEWRQRA
jgi:nitroreductase